MYAEQEDVFFYLTLMNENYPHGPLPEGVEEGILRGMYLLHDAGSEAKVQLMGSGTILREVEAAAELLESDFGVKANVWSATSFTEMRRDGMETERWNLLHPGEEQRVPYVASALDGHAGPLVAASDYIRAFPDQIRPYIGDRSFTALGTDGYGRSDFRATLRSFFEVDRHHVVLAALRELGDDKAAKQAIEKYGIETESEAPWLR
jgi:pyruvate dehydrogenase E1 component